MTDKQELKLKVLDPNFTREQFMKENFKAVKALHSMFKGDKKVYDNLALASKQAIKNKFEVIIKDKLLTIAEVLNSKASNKQKENKVQKILYQIKNCMETLPYTITTKHSKYTDLRKRVLEVLGDHVGTYQICCINLLFALTDEEQRLRNRTTNKAKKRKIYETTTVKMDFMQTVYKPTAIKMLETESISTLTIALIMITGRRVAEVVQAMELDFSNYEKTKKVLFTGQKKKKSFLDAEHEKDDGLEIPLLIDPENIPLLKRRFKMYKEMVRNKEVSGEPLKDLDYRKFTNWSGFIRRKFTKATIISGTTGTQLKALRALYACYMLHTDKTRAKMKLGATAYLATILGHDETGDSYLNYDNFAIDEME